MIFSRFISQVTSVWPHAFALLLCLAGSAGQAHGAINLIINGDFESGNTGFTSGYVTFPGAIGVTEATYQVLQNPSIGGNGFATSYGDHTTGTGLMMAVNGAPVPNIVVWQETVAVTANTTYDFAAYLSSWFPANPALLDFSVNGTSIGQLQGISTTGVWNLFFSTWNSGAATSATIAIVNRNTAVQGNDFALDDIFFGDPVFSQPGVVPEPASLTIWGLGALGCAIGAYRRRKRAA